MNYKVLLLDDERILLQGLANKIGMMDLPLRIIGEAGDGEEGLVYLERELPDIVITDIRMPEMDGLRFIEHVRAMRKPIHCVIVSGYNDLEYARKASRLGVQHYLFKPVDHAELQSVLTGIVLQLRKGDSSHDE
ncbi:response regulator [Paenibacillus rhizovicinus]|uniref:Response regulator n=1 Tax=Paenibacillus rhizovicinus TaxID=2704463 RepID=A0A6C0P5E9_9BACL|nr:response regulator [Paenibacillus rhizovicinus]QHW33739.1 response regulator [Paenibacillus rhizovicinus]